MSVAREKACISRQDAKNAKKSVNGQREKDVWNSRVMAFLSDLCGLSECNERAREKAYDSRKDAENAKESVKMWKE